MALKAEAKTTYMREYMRRRRSEAQAARTTAREPKLAAALAEIEQARESLRQLSTAAQQQLDATIRQHKKNLDAEFNKCVEEEVARRMRNFVVPHFEEEIAFYEKTVKTRKGIMDNAAYRLIWSCLHDDSRKSVSTERLNKAFNIWTEVKLKVLDEKETPTTKFKSMPDIPAPRQSGKQRLRRRRSDNGRSERAPTAERRVRW